MATERGRIACNKVLLQALQAFLAVRSPWLVLAFEEGGANLGSSSAQPLGERWSTNKLDYRCLVQNSCFPYATLCNTVWNHDFARQVRRS
jgi:hypothetical protein